VIILEYIPGITLMTLFQGAHSLDLPKMKSILVNILSTIKECHSRNVIHRDIKPQNIILSPRDLKPKLIDFGLALMTTTEMEPYNYYKCGTVNYTAPEVLLTDSMFYKSYGYKCDIFSFGVVAHMLLMGRNPLAGISEIERKKNIHVQLKEDEIE
jgi:serine/threonine protein kinase